MPQKGSIAELGALLDATRRRLRLRGATRGAARAAWLGAILGAGTAGIGAVWGAGPGLAWALAAAVAGCVTAAGALAGAVTTPLAAREAALLLDRRLETRELFVTALHVAERRAAHAADVLAALEDRLSAGVDLAAAVPVRVPRHARWLALAPVIWVGLALLPPIGAPRADRPAAPLAQEGQRLAERLDQVQGARGEVLPAELQQDAEALADAMRAEALTEEEARRRLQDLQARLGAFEQSVAPSVDVLDALEAAAAELDASTTSALADALARGDLGAAGEAARALSRTLADASPEARRQAADGLARAGDGLAQSEDAALRDAGRAMQDAARALQGEDGRGLGPEATRQLGEELARNQALAERLEQDREALRQSQELNGALEAARQRLGGAPSVPQGASSQGAGEPGAGEPGAGEPGAGEPGGGEPGVGEGAQQGLGERRGMGSGEGSETAGAPGAGPLPGQGHTWEDAGEHVSPPAGEQPDRLSGRTQGQVIDDFERIYASVRLEGAQALLASERGQLDATGRVDELAGRRTAGDERATLPRLDLPAAYEEAAADAVRSEDIPPGYREAVKRYFDDRRLEVPPGPRPVEQ